MQRYFAQLDENNIVIRVVVSNDISWCENNLGGRWRETYTDKSNKNYAGIGYIYDDVNENFYSKQPHKSWILNENLIWEAPISYPDDGGDYMWSEKEKNWVVDKYSK